MTPEILIQLIFWFIGLIGSAIAALLGLHAFFGRKTLEKITSMDNNLKEATTILKYTDERSRRNTEEIEKLKDGQVKIRERVHTLEGHSFNFGEFIKGN